jgi:hypothetical protein
MRRRCPLASRHPAPTNCSACARTTSSRCSVVPRRRASSTAHLRDGAREPGDARDGQGRRTLPIGDTVGHNADERVLVQRMANPTDEGPPVIRLDLDKRKNE